MNETKQLIKDLQSIAALLGTEIPDEAMEIIDRGALQDNQCHMGHWAVFDCYIPIVEDIKKP